MAVSKNEIVIVGLACRTDDSIDLAAFVEKFFSPIAMDTQPGQKIVKPEIQILLDLLGDIGLSSSKLFERSIALFLPEESSSSTDADSSFASELHFQPSYCASFSELLQNAYNAVRSGTADYALIGGGIAFALASQDRARIDGCRIYSAIENLASSAIDLLKVAGVNSEHVGLFVPGIAESTRSFAPQTSKSQPSKSQPSKSQPSRSQIDWTEAQSNYVAVSAQMAAKDNGESAASALLIAAVSTFLRVMPRSSKEASTLFPGFITYTDPRPWIHPVLAPEPDKPRRAVVSFDDCWALLRECDSDLEQVQDRILTRQSSEIFLFDADDPVSLVSKLRSFDFSDFTLAELACAHYFVSRLSDRKVCRLAFIASSTEELAKLIDAAIERIVQNPFQPIALSRKASGFTYSALGPPGAQKIAFVLPGLGASYPNMLSDLSIYFPEVRAVFDFVERLAVRASDSIIPSRAVFPVVSGATQLASQAALATIDSAVVTLLLAEWAIFHLLEKCGVHPDAFLGCSTGEFAVITMNKAIDIYESAQMFYRLSTQVSRSIPMSELSRLRSIRISASFEERIAPLLSQLSGTVYLGAELSKTCSLVSGEKSAMDELTALLKKNEIDYIVLPIAIPYHTPLVADKLDHSDDELLKLAIQAPQIESWSCSLAGHYPEDVDGLRRLATGLFEKPIQLRSTVERMYAEGTRIFVEVGPKGGMTPYVAEVLHGRPHVAIACNVAEKTGIDQFHIMLATLFTAGVDVNLKALFERRFYEPSHALADDVSDEENNARSDFDLFTSTLALIDPFASDKQPGKGVLAEPGVTDQVLAELQMAFSRFSSASAQSTNAGQAVQNLQASELRQTDQIDQFDQIDQIVQDQPVNSEAPSQPSQTDKFAQPVIDDHSQNSDIEVRNLDSIPSQPDLDQAAPIQSTAGAEQVVASYFESLTRVHETMLNSSERVLHAYLETSLGDAWQSASSQTNVDYLLDRKPFLRDAEFSHSLEEIGRGATGSESIRARMTLDLERHPFLLDHSIGADLSSFGTQGRVYLLPLMVAIEIMLETAALFFPTQLAIRLSDIRAYKRIRVGHDPVILIASAIQISETSVEVSLSSSTEEDAILASCQVRFADRYPNAPAPAVYPKESVRSSRLSKLYGSQSMFHGPRMQSVESIDLVSNKTIEGKIKARPATNWFGDEQENGDSSRFMLDPLLLDNLSQFVLYQMHEHEMPVTALLPFHIASIDLFQTLDGAFECELDAAVHLRSMSLRGTLALMQLSSDGRLLAQVDEISSRAIVLTPNMQKLVFHPAENISIIEDLSSWEMRASEILKDNRAVITSLRSNQFSDDETVLDWLTDYVLSEEEQGQWQTLGKSAKRRREWFMGRIAAKDAVRILLHRRGYPLFCSSDIQIVANPGGDISVLLPPAAAISVDLLPQISISHCNSMACAIAIFPLNNSLVSESVVAGIDVEEICEREEGFTNLAFNYGELTLLSKFPPEEQSRWISAFWSAKEASAKAHRTGFNGNPRSFEVLSVKDEARTLVVLAPSNGEEFPTTYQCSIRFDDENSVSISVVTGSKNS